jgi:hypothetical protein
MSLEEFPGDEAVRISIRIFAWPLFGTMPKSIGNIGLINLGN